MGKRKLHDTTFYQCDWTGLSLKQAFCYMPSWNAEGKLVKRGSYANWESVVAHAKELHNTNQDSELLAKQLLHIKTICGTVPQSAPHYSELAHTKGHMREIEFHLACKAQTQEVSVVLLKPGEDPDELSVIPHRGGGTFGDMLTPSETYKGPAAHFSSMRKKTMFVDVVAFYLPQKDLPFNHVASNMFRMQLYGDVLLVGQSKESSFLPRERFVNYTLEMFEEQSKKRKASTPAMTPTEYVAQKASMQESLDSYEGKMSAGSAAPESLKPGAAKHTLASKASRAPPEIKRTKSFGPQHVSFGPGISSPTRR